VLDNDGYYYYDYDYSPVNFVIGNGNITAAYFLGDYAINSILRVSGGLRLEYTNMQTDVKMFHELNLPANHPDRNVATAGGGYNLPSAKPGILKSYNYLPSVNVVCNLVSKDKYKLITRFNYSHTIARPSLREITPLYQEDFILQKDILGNPRLKIVDVDNFDFRMESLFDGGDNLFVSLFYKNFENHIELVEVPYTTWKNAQTAKAYGIEIEGQKNITKNLDIRANVTFIKSDAKIELEQQTITHPMFGQAPYIINAILGYNSEKLRLNAALSYNVQGRKLALVTKRSSHKENSDIYEMPQHLLDLKLAKSVGKHFGMSFRVRNILNSPVRRSYDYKNTGLIDYDRYDYGSEYLFGVSYTL
jgi:outer membrane receptor protein involved in Fe transport